MGIKIMGIKISNRSDPTDRALAAVASALDTPEADREPAKSTAEENLAPVSAAEADGYTKIGPGPIVALRFKWTVRRDDDGEYHVDETIGENSPPIVNGPMTKEAAVQLVDDREREARARFEALRAEMTERAAGATAGTSGGKI
jgi:hypothetical protein